MARLQVFLDLSIKENLLLQPFYEMVAAFNLSIVDPDHLEVKNTLLILSHEKNLDTHLKRFKYYKDCWFFVAHEGNIDLTQKENIERCFYFSPDQLDLASKILTSLNNISNFSYLQQQIDEMNSNWNKVIQEASRYLELAMNLSRFDLARPKSSPDLSALTEMTEFILLKRELYKLTSFQEVLHFFSNSFEKFGISSVRIIKKDEILELPYPQKRLILLPSPSKNYGDALCFEYKTIFDAKICFVIYELMIALERFHLRETRIFEINHEDSLWENAFHLLDLPLVLLSDNGEVILNNNEFSKLNLLPKECLLYSHGEQVEASHQPWRVNVELIKHGTHNYRLLTFETDGITSNKGSELGIISGSLAHELNNPLAGILAALALLELEDDWDEDSLASLKEMKESARRCKDLVEIFLGFSRVEPEEAQTKKASDSLKQALNLLRFRMIESDVRLEISFQDRDSKQFDKMINPSVMAMIFYLLMTDLLTQFSQLDLLHNDEGRNKCLQGVFLETENQLSLYFAQSFAHKDIFEISKLLQHLLQIEGLKFEKEGQQIKLIRTGLF